MLDNPLLKVLFHNEHVRIASFHDFDTTDVRGENLDFYVTYQQKTYTGTAFTLSSISQLMQGAAYFWCSDFIVIREFTAAALIEAIVELIADDTVELADIFYLNQGLICPTN